MRKLLLLIILVVCAVYSQSVTILSPNGGESWGAGTTQTITWNYDFAESEQVKIELYEDLIFVDEIAITSCTGIYQWDIPSGIAVSDIYKIRIESIDQTGISDESDGYFKIFTKPTQVQLISPTNGSVLENQKPEFKWNMVQNAEEYVLRYTCDINWDEYSEVILTDTTYTPETDLNIGEYRWSVEARNSLGTGEESDEWSFIVNAFTEIDVGLIGIGYGS